MTAVFGFATVIISVVFILRRIMGPIPAFILVPAVISLTAGYGWQTGDFILKGMRAVAPIGIMFIFATLFFCVIINSAALVRHGQTQAFFGSGQQVAHLLHAGRQPDGTVFWGISQGIVQKDGQDLLQALPIPVYPGQGGLGKF